MNFLAEQKLTLKNLWLPKETGWWGDGLGVWDGNVKLRCDDGCTTINIIKLMEKKKKEKQKKKNKKQIYSYQRGKGWGGVGEG